MDLDIVLVDPLLKARKEYKNLKKQEMKMNQNELDKAYFQNGMAYGDVKDLTRRATFDKIMCDQAFNIAKSPRYNGYPCELASMVYKYFEKEISDSGIKN